MLKLLLAAGADATAADDDGWTPLHSVALHVRKDDWHLSDPDCKYALAEMMEALLAAGASLDAPTDWGLTPRHLLLQHARRTLGATAAAQLTGVSKTELQDAEDQCRRTE